MNIKEIKKAVEEIQAICQGRHCLECGFGYEGEDGIPHCIFRNDENKKCNPEDWTLQEGEWHGV